MSIEKYPIRYTGSNPLSPRGKRSRKGWYMPLMVAATLIFLKPSLGVSQQVGCSCTPLEYRWILNFTNPCPTANIAPNAGMKVPFCSIDVDTTRNVFDSVPVVVSSYLFVELDGGSISRNNVSLTDGDVIELVSTTMARPRYISKRFLVEITGRNAADEKVELSVFVTFTNICEQPPFLLGDSIGWITYGPDVVFRSKTCFPSSHSTSPSLSPSITNPYASPTRAPRHQPSRTPTTSKKSKKSKKSKVSKSSKKTNKSDKSDKSNKSDASKFAKKSKKAKI